MNISIRENSLRRRVYDAVYPIDYAFTYIRYFTGTRESYGWPSFSGITLKYMDEFNQNQQLQAH